jgi:hypothetical protein
MAKIDLGQIDEFKYTFTEEAEEGDVPVWKTAESQFVPEPRWPDPDLQLRRVFLLMGA